jgi:hypothetical protein
MCFGKGSAQPAEWQRIHGAQVGERVHENATTAGEYRCFWDIVITHMGDSKAVFAQKVRKNGGSRGVITWVLG